MLLKKSENYLYPLFLSLFLFSCEDKPLMIKDDDLSLKIDTVSFLASESLTYQVPPTLGGSKKIYIGKNDQFDFEYALVRFDKTASRRFDPLNGNLVDDFIDYNDTLLTLDSLDLSLYFTSDSVNSSSIFQLHYYPNAVDSVFSQTQTNYTNLNPNFSKIISRGKVFTDTSYSLSRLSFEIDTSDFSLFMDTSIVSFNNTFLISILSDENQIYELFSVNEGSNYPILSVFFNYQINDSTTIDTFNIHNSVEDLSILKPPNLASLDTLNLSISLAKGLKSLLIIDTEDWVLPHGSVIRNAELLLHPISIDTSDASIINSYPVSGALFPSDFQSYLSDPFTYNINYGVSSVIASDIKFNHRLGSNDFFKNNNSLHVFNLQSSSLNNPFKTISFHSKNSTEFYPKLRILYVTP